MSAGTCVICWDGCDVEEHHIAGRSNHDRTVPLCKSCHKLMTIHQRQQGIDLTGNWRPYQEKVRAVILGHMMIWRHMMESWMNNFSYDLRESDATIQPPQPTYGIKP